MSGGISDSLRSSNGRVESRGRQDQARRPRRVPKPIFRTGGDPADDFIVLCCITGRVRIVQLLVSQRVPLWTPSTTAL